MNADSIIYNIGEHLGIPELKLSDNLTCNIVLDNQLSINIEYSQESNELHCYTIFPPSLFANFTDTATKLLEANLFTFETQGATFALNKTTGDIILCQCFDLLFINYQLFNDKFDIFVQTAAYWQGQFNQGHSW
ncbi:type III secretion system chaperone [Endozoicomonas sp. SM1973]|uniref:Type III secretion system chaperone n=1 Tax=Spartinivicinus marinus TaxID=2994442 RepID=A0A853HYB1_9GAMM|nr:type III secretion system chaperone [Spartinivicinus marinus]MCX4028142.1 type III secretion system chaperone [Spartinivicinus marinus]NYZ66183.1 type III secretion system chaperone [Spartinivicinus marinus]